MASKRILWENTTSNIDNCSDILTWANLDNQTTHFLRQDAKVKTVLQLRLELKAMQSSVSIETKKVLMLAEQRVKEQAYGLRPNLFSRFIIQEVEDFGTWPLTPGRNGVMVPVLTYTVALMSLTITGVSLQNNMMGKLVIRDDIALLPTLKGDFLLLVSHLYAGGTFLIDQIKDYTSEEDIRTISQKLVVMFQTNALRLKVNNLGTVKALQSMLDYTMNGEDRYAAWLAKPFCQWDNLYTDCITLSREALLDKVMLFCHSQSKVCATTVTWSVLGLNQAISNMVNNKSTFLDRSSNTPRILHILSIARTISNFYIYSKDQLTKNPYILTPDRQSLLTCLWPSDKLTFKSKAMSTSGSTLASRENCIYQVRSK